MIKSSLLFASGTFLSRITGLIRDQVILGVFGASLLLDAFFVAFRIPNLFREMLAEGALGSAFTRVYSGLKEQDEEAAAALLVRALYLTFLMALVIAALGLVLAPWMVRAMTFLKDPGPEREILVHEATGLTRLLFPYLGLTIMGSVVTGALYDRGRYFLSAVAPMAFNLGYIVGALLLSRLMERISPHWWAGLVADPAISGLAIGVLLGGLAQFYMQFRGLRHAVQGRRPAGPLWDARVKRVVTLMVPGAIAAGAGPINLLVNTNFATSLAEGTVTWLAAAFRLLQLPIGLFGVAVGVAVLPGLSRSIEKRRQQTAAPGIGEEAGQQLQAALELVVWLMIPCLVFLEGLNVPVIRLLFQHGQFGERDALATAAALQFYGLGVVAYGLIKVLTSYYYAVERTTFAMRVSLFSIFVNFLGNYLLVDRLGFRGLALTASLTLSCNALFLIVGLRGDRIGWDGRLWLRSLVILGVSAAAAWTGQRLCQQALLPLHYGNPGAVKLNAAAEVVSGGLAILLFFSVGGMVRLRTSPAGILRKLRQLKG